MSDKMSCGRENGNQFFAEESKLCVSFQRNQHSSVQAVVQTKLWR